MKKKSVFDDGGLLNWKKLMLWAYAVGKFFHFNNYDVVGLLNWKSKIRRSQINLCCGLMPMAIYPILTIKLKNSTFLNGWEALEKSLFTGRFCCGYFP